MLCTNIWTLDIKNRRILEKSEYRRADGTFYTFRISIQTLYNTLELALYIHIIGICIYKLCYAAGFHNFIREIYFATFLKVRTPKYNSDKLAWIYHLLFFRLTCYILDHLFYHDILFILSSYSLVWLSLSLSYTLSCVIFLSFIWHYTLSANLANQCIFVSPTHFRFKVSFWALSVLQPLFVIF